MKFKELRNRKKLNESVDYSNEDMALLNRQIKGLSQKVEEAISRGFELDMDNILEEAKLHETDMVMDDSDFAETWALRGKSVEEAAVEAIEEAFQTLSEDSAPAVAMQLEVMVDEFLESNPE